jgi:tetratricopeptide (TPR) repeat protein
MSHALGTVTTKEGRTAPVKFPPFALLGLVWAASLSGASETATQRTLKGIVERQKILLAQAARTDDKLDEGSLKVQLTQLTHEYQLLLLNAPDFAEAYASYGYLLSKLNLNSEAMKQLLKADHLDPNIALVKNQLGNVLAEGGKPLEAINYFQAAEQLEPAEPLYHYQVGLVLYEGRDEFLAKGGFTQDQLAAQSHEEFGRAAQLAPKEEAYAYRYAESFYDLPHPDWEEAFHAWSELEAKAGGTVERQTMMLQEANVRLKQGRADQARSIMDRVTEPALLKQKEKLVAQLALNARK